MNATDTTAKPALTAAGPTTEELAAALAEYEKTNDRAKVVVKYHPWLAQYLNKTKA